MSYKSVDNNDYTERVSSVRGDLQVTTSPR